MDSDSDKSDDNDLDYQLTTASQDGLDSEVLDLLQRGANPNHTVYRPLHYACYNNNPHCTELLIKWGVSLSLTGGYSEATALHYACEYNSIECAKVLMSYNSPTDIKDLDKKTAEDLAKDLGNEELADFIAGYKVRPRDPLTTYPSYEQLRQLCVEQWLELGLHFHLSEDQLKKSNLSENPTSAVLIAAKVNNTDLNWKQIVEGLLTILEYKLAESLCLRHGEGHTALAICGFYCWLNLLKYLVETRGLNPSDPVNEAGDTVVSIACIRGHIGVIDYLVKNKHWDPDGIVNAVGDTLKSLATSQGLSDIINYLDNLSADLADSEKQQRYMKILDEMISDKRNTILLHYQKMHFIGSSGLGKSTTRKRLTGLITNLAALPEEERKHYSTNLAECTQVLALMSDSDSKLTLQVSGGHDEETRMLFAYMYSSRFTGSLDSSSVIIKDNPLPVFDEHTRDQRDATLPRTPTQEFIRPIEEAAKATPDSGSSEQVMVTVSDVDRVIARLRSIVSSGKYTEQLQNKILLNLVDIGGQPGFLEMLPFLSKGPGMFLAFFRLDKDLGEPCEVSYVRGENTITPYKAIYTFHETLSQILASIKHHVTFDSDIDQKLQEKLGDLADMKPVATLIGTFKDKLETKVKTDIIMEEMSTRFSETPECEKKNIIEHAIAKSFEVQSTNQPAVDSKVNLKVQGAVNELLDSKSFKEKVEECLGKELEKKDQAISFITRKFEDLMFPTVDSHQFIALDNFTGTELDIDPLREHLQEMFINYFKNAKLRIRPSQLLLGVILRKEYDIVSMNDCIHIGRALSMGEEEVEFTVWYLDRWVGALIYHPEIKDKWFIENIICSPQVVFDSISSLIVESILEIHSPKGKQRRIRFTAAETKNWTEKGQFSLDTVKRCHSEENKQNVEKGKLIPVEKLVKFLEESHLLSLITTTKIQGRRETKEIMCFIPAILECISPEELTKSPPADADTPSPIKITFECGYVPIGVFCAMISCLVTKGSAREGILGMKWELVESQVKRNLVSFYVGSARHKVTLIAHAHCYEIRVKPRHKDSSIHDICSYTLSTVLFVMKVICNLIDPIFAFDCVCDQYEMLEVNNSDHLCCLRGEEENCIFFECRQSLNDVTFTKSQEYWFTKEVKSGSDVCLKALPYVKGDPGVSFKWSRDGGSNNKLRLEKVTTEHCTGYYSCEIIKNGEYLFSVHHCLKATEPEQEVILPKVCNERQIEPDLVMNNLKKKFKVSDEQLNIRIEETDLPELAECFENTDDYVEKLKLLPGQQTDVKTRSFVYGTEDGMKLALKHWIKGNVNSATYKNLLLILLSMKKGETAVRVCKHLSQQTANRSSKRSSESESLSSKKQRLSQQDDDKIISSDAEMSLVPSDMVTREQSDDQMMTS